MRELVFLEPGRLAFRDVPPPSLEGPGEALVRPLAVARCDLDAGVLFGEAPFRGRALHWLRNHLPEAIGQRRIFRDAPFRGPYAFGHESVGEVVEVGRDVTTVRPGDRVIVPFQISCGACERCRRGQTASCTGVPPRSMYGFGALGGQGWGGVLADLVRVPFADAMLVPVPAGVDPVTIASLSDNIVDGLRTVKGPLARAPGARVLVVGGGAASIGLYAVTSAVALGAGEVVYVDRDRTRLEIAGRLGARPLEEPARRQPVPFAITVDASADPEGLSAALRSTEPGGICTSVGIYYTPTTPVPLLAMYGIGLTFVTGRVDSRTLVPDALALVVDGRLRPEPVTTRVATWEEAPEALLDRGPKVVIARR